MTIEVLLWVVEKTWVQISLLIEKEEKGCIAPNCEDLFSGDNQAGNSAGNTHP